MPATASAIGRRAADRGRRRRASRPAAEPL